MLQIFFITLRGIIRDRIFQGIAMVAVLFLFIPSISSLSMRQVSELSLTLSLSLISFMLLLLSVFLGGTALWKDMDRKYTFGVLGLPLSRSSYVVGKFAGIAGFLLITAAALGLAACAVAWFVAGKYPPLRPILWTNVSLTVMFAALKYVLLVAFAFLLSTVSTSFFLPIFGTISVLLAGGATQQVYDYLHSSAGQSFSPLLKAFAAGLYYLLPNFTAFDLKANAIYGLSLSYPGLFLTLCYFVVYTGILLTLACILFSRRELR
jgi:ABC-type transport system involved in multi-copper enzyme maturation permease subunit